MGIALAMVSDSLFGSFVDCFNPGHYTPQPIFGVWVDLIRGEELLGDSLKSGAHRSIEGAMAIAIPQLSVCK
jgi:hypothetical protein